MTNFWQGLEEFEQQETKPVEIEFRLYYNKHGYPLFYSTEDLSGNYIVIDHNTYIRGDYQNIKVKDGRILQRNPADSTKLIHDDSAGTCCFKNDVTLIDNTGQGQYWKLKTHEYR